MPPPTRANNACVEAPMFQIGQTYYGNLTPEKIDEILEGLD